LKPLNLSPAARLSFGLAALVVSMLLILDVFGVIPDPAMAQRQLRQNTSENLGLQVAQLLRRGDNLGIGKALTEFRQRSPEVQSVALIKTNGDLVAQVGEHTRHWQTQEAGRDNINQISVTLMQQARPWGRLEFSYQPYAPRTLAGLFRHHLLLMALFMGTVGFFSFYFFLRRALQYLDPSSVVPERVRRAFDTLSEGIAILDQSGQIMLTNSAFKYLHPNATADLTGRNIETLDWLWSGLDPDASRHPWRLAISKGEQTKGLMLPIAQPDGSTIKTVISITPVQAPDGAVRGCLISLENVSELHRVNEQLLNTLADLEQSNRQLAQKTEELQLIASRDPLTGCFNRRAFFELLETIYVKAKQDGGVFCCIMADIDHFKSFNDRYGHAVGDEVIRAVVRNLQGGLRQQDVLCRYGGEEFCIVLPNTPLQVALEVAERLRHSVEQNAGSSLRTLQDVRVTSSFGAAESDATMLDPAELIGRADEALYASKKTGRNKVSAWSSEMAGQGEK
jgi:diguanylate cyclase (GGDEF)-like protein/PAS domain S-box-containing protein